MLDSRIKAKVLLPLLDVAYGELNGFNQAVNLSKEKLGNVKFVEEKELLDEYFEKISRDGNVVFGVRDTLIALEAGAAETLILWDNLKLERCKVSSADGIQFVKIVDPNSSVSVEENEHIEENEQLLDWLVNNKFSAKIRFVSDNTSEGSQFVKGFGGIGALLQYKLDLNNFLEEDDDDLYLSD
ncbi:unnamed protein product [Sphagnum tenellum]